MRIGYLASHYPAVSHAFVLREVGALRRTGVEVDTFSIHAAPAEQLLAAADREEARSTATVLPVRPAGLVLAHLLAFALAPQRYLATLAFAVRRANPGLRGRLWGLFYFAEAMIVWRSARRRRVRHLHAVFADVASDVALLVTRYGGPGWSWSIAVHGPVEFYDVEAGHLPEKLASARFALAISDFGRGQLMAFSPESRWSDLHVVHCGLEPAAWTPDPTPERPAGRLVRVICVGRLIDLKGQSLLLAAHAELRRRGVEVELTVVGTGPNEAALHARTRELGIEDSVTFTGAVGQDEIRDLYRRSDIFCLPSMAEGLPVVLMEAMALELAVVTTRIMGIPELVEDGRTGLLVAPGRVDQLVAALERLTADPELRAELGRAGREKVVAEFDVDAQARHLHAILAGYLEPAA